ncbi:MAG: phospholipid carrier-dependent glycosyltransferase [bacterium]|nr:phospholipid carrier-dependent glycosyltransferase [bacterium]
MMDQSTPESESSVSSSDSIEAPTRHASRPPARAWCLLAAALVIVIGLRLPYSDQLVIDRDETVYFVAAQDLAHGGSLYATAWSHKGPMLFAILGPAVSVFGNSVEALRHFTTAYLLLSMLLVYLIGRRLFAAELAALGAAAYGVFFSVPTFGGLASNAELFMMLPASAAILCLLIFLEPRKSSMWLALAGITSATAVLIKPPALYTVAVIPLWLVLRRARQRESANARLLVRELACYGTGGIAVVGAVFTYFALQGTIAEFLYATLWFNMDYVATVPATIGWRNLFNFLAWTVRTDVFTMLWIGGLALLTLRRRELGDNRWKVVLVWLLAAGSLFGVALGRNMYAHYYLQMGLAISLVGALALATLEIDARLWAKIGGIGMLFLAWSTFAPGRAETIRNSYLQQDQNTRAVAQYVSQHTQPDQQIFVMGPDAIIYFLSERSAPTRYFLSLFHSGRWGYLLGIDRDVPATMRQHPPQLIVHKPSDPRERTPQIEHFVQEKYLPDTKLGEYQIYRLAEPEGTSNHH